MGIHKNIFAQQGSEKIGRQNGSAAASVPLFICIKRPFVTILEKVNANEWKVDEFFFFLFIYICICFWFLPFTSFSRPVTSLNR